MGETRRQRNLDELSARLDNLAASVLDAQAPQVLYHRALKVLAKYG